MVPEETTVLALSDNDASKHDMLVDGFRVIDPASLSNIGFD